MIQRDFGFLKISSRLIKIAAWTFLLLGIISGIGTLTGLNPAIPRWMGIFIIIIYICGFFLVYLIALMADLLMEIWQYLKKERF